MKIFLTVLLVSISLFSALADIHVKGYTRKDGTYVAPHVRSSPNSTNADNWSTKGNVNPYTGKAGTKNATVSELASSGISEIPTGSLVEGWVQNSYITRGLELQEGARIYSAPSKDATLLAGDADAQYNLGMKYLEGKGVPRDYTEAVNLLQSAAMQGDARAQYELGSMYANGKGVEASFIYAHVWWNLAAASGHQGAKSRLDSLEPRMSTQSITEAMKLARELFAKLPRGK